MLVKERKKKKTRHLILTSFVKHVTRHDHDGDSDQDQLDTGGRC